MDVSGPEALVLVGLGRGVEARIGFPDVVGLDLRGEPARGLGDAALGVKVETGRVAGWRTGVLAEVSLPPGPTASEAARRRRSSCSWQPARSAA